MQNEQQPPGTSAAPPQGVQSPSAAATTPPPKAPTISRLNPDDGPSGGGTEVTITGTDFGGENSSMPEVWFGGIAVPVQSWTDTEIIVNAPPLNLGRATGTAKLPVTVKTKHGTAEAQTFSYND